MAIPLDDTVYVVDAFIISKVRDVDPETDRAVRAYAHNLERQGKTVHCPLRGDTDQNDPIGTAICATNRAKPWRAREVHVFFDESSQGMFFDMGMVFAFLLFAKKKIVLANRDVVKAKATPGEKSFQNVLLELERMFS